MELTRKGIVEYAERHGWEEIPAAMPGTTRLQIPQGKGEGFRNLWVYFDHGPQARPHHAVATVKCDVDQHMSAYAIQAYLKGYGS